MDVHIDKCIDTIKGGSRHAEKRADDDEGFQTGVGRSWTREEAGLDQEQG